MIESVKAPVPGMLMFIHELFDAWNSHDVERILRCCEADFEGEDMGFPVPIRGADGIRAWVAPYLAAFPDLKFALNDSVMEGDRVVVAWTARGTHQGPLMGVPATGRAVEFQGMSMLTMGHHAVRKARYMWDALALLKQLGALA